MKCEKCKYFKDVFGNFVQCVKIGRFLDWEYWNNIEPDDCPVKENINDEDRSNSYSQNRT